MLRETLMKIKSAFLKSETSLDPIFKMEKIDNKKILECLKQSWECVLEFSKNIDSDATNYYADLLENICSEDIPIHEEMLKESRTNFISIKENTDVKSYIRSYFGLLQTLLIYNQPFTECCDVCQGVLYYYFEEETKDVIKECSTCGTLFFAITGERVSTKIVINLRPAKKDELKFLL